MVTTRRGVKSDEAALSSPPTPSTTSTTTTSPLAMDTPTTSPYLPTPLEGIILAIYPTTLLLGSLYSTLHPSTRGVAYNATAQSYLPHDAPSYFAKKSNILNVYFVKVGWLWTTLAFVLLLLTHPGLGPAWKPVVTKRRVQAATRYAAVTLAWVFVTQWFFGPAVIDRSFRWTGGACEAFDVSGSVRETAKEELADASSGKGDFVAEVFSHAACKAVGGQWRGGHDISGHVFLLILASAMLVFEVLPGLVRSSGGRESRRIMTREGTVRSAGFEASRPGEGPNGDSSLGRNFALGVAGVSLWMLLMTAAFFHTWFEKMTGLLVAMSTVYIVYFLPRAVPVLRGVLGMPGI